jgi:hypothetical protein
MFLFELLEQSRRGFDPTNLPPRIFLTSDIAARVNSELKSGRETRLVRAEGIIGRDGDGAYALMSPPVFSGAESLALVWVRTAPEIENGKIRLTAALRENNVWQPFHKSGCAVFHGNENDAEDALVIVPPRGTFRIERPAQSVAPELFVRWDGCGGLEIGVPRRYAKPEEIRA